MRVAYFSSDTHPYHLAIYPGVGPAFARPLGWPALPLSQLASGACDVAVVDNRLEAPDVALLEALLERPAAERPPIFFRISDPDMPRSDNANVRFIFRQANRPGVHFATTYDPAGPFLDFVRSLSQSKVVPLPYAYDATRELNLGLAGRSRRIFLSGARNKALYPLRHKIRRQSKWSPLGRLMVFDLRHPGYPEAAPLRHNVTHERFIAMATRFAFFRLWHAV